MPPEPDRRRHVRYRLPSMYTMVRVRAGDDARLLAGHVYDVSTGGMRFELDGPLQPGERVRVSLHLPGTSCWSAPSGQVVETGAVVVWVEEEDVATSGPVRMACVFTDIAEADRERLTARLQSGRYAIAA